jgi:hypothetical protein
MYGIIGIANDTSTAQSAPQPWFSSPLPGDFSRVFNGTFPLKLYRHVLRPQFLLCRPMPYLERGDRRVFHQIPKVLIAMRDVPFIYTF